MRLRLLISFALVIFVALGSVFLVVNLTAEQQVRTYFGRSALAGVQNLVEQLQNYYKKTPDWSGVSNVFNDEAGIQATSPSPRQGMGYGQDQGQSLGRGKSDHILTDNSGIIVYSAINTEIGQTVTDETLAISIPIENNGEIVAYLLPAGGVPDLPENYESELIQRIQQATLIAAGISGVIAILLALVLSRMIMKPVKVLTNAADILSKGDLNHRVKLTGSTELISLGNTFNQMADALQIVEQQRRAMTADIAHELRTPLAVQRANLEALQDGVYPLNMTALTPIIEQNRLLTRLVDDLRTLALMDAGELSLNIRPFSLADLCAKTIFQFESMLDTSDIKTIQKHQPDLPQVNADPERVSQILHNLLQNAYRYSNPGTNVYISTFKVGKMACLTVRDQGPGIPSDKIDKIFERFYRVSKGRDREKGGTGLGLSIARKLAEAQGGNLTADNHKEGGAIFTLSIPLNIESHSE